MKDKKFQIRKDERFDTMQTGLASKNVGKDQTDRVMMGLELLCTKHGVEVPV